MLTKEEMPACPVATTVQLIGSKWKLLIMRNLLQRPWRFNELRDVYKRQPHGRVTEAHSAGPRRATAERTMEC